MPLDRSRLHKGFATYLHNAEKASGRTYEDFARTLAGSGLEKHSELRVRLMDQFGLGHGHANAVVAIWLKFADGAAPPAKKAATSPARKGPAKKAPAKKTPTKKT